MQQQQVPGPLTLDFEEQGWHCTVLRSLVVLLITGAHNQTSFPRPGTTERSSKYISISLTKELMANTRISPLIKTFKRGFCWLKAQHFLFAVLPYPPGLPHHHPDRTHANCSLCYSYTVLWERRN